jgi:hypothetical protein
MSSDLVTIEYIFALADGREKRFILRLQQPTLQLSTPRPDPLPDWTRLEHHGCPNCPLRPAEHPHCPIAANLADVIETFKDTVSIESADITIRSENRTYFKRADLQYGISALMGLYMTTSGCPVMDKLRPMVQTHLPFANIKETMFRAASMYLLAQFFIQKRGGQPDWELSKLVQIYDDVRVVNRAFSRRLRSINPQDASLNALANLDCFALATSFSIAEENLHEIESLFAAYLEHLPPPPASDTPPSRTAGSTRPKG